MYGIIDDAIPILKESIMDIVLDKVMGKNMVDSEEYMPPAKMNILSSARARILYTLFPFDRSIWRVIKNPLYWVFLILCSIPTW